VTDDGKLDHGADQEGGEDGRGRGGHPPWTRKRRTSTLHQLARDNKSAHNKKMAITASEVMLNAWGPPHKIRSTQFITTHCNNNTYSIILCTIQECILLLLLSITVSRL
jgi:hypothetical protein